MALGLDKPPPDKFSGRRATFSPLQFVAPESLRHISMTSTNSSDRNGDFQKCESRRAGGEAVDLIYSMTSCPRAFARIVSYSSDCFVGLTMTLANSNPSYELCTQGVMTMRCSRTACGTTFIKRQIFPVRHQNERGLCTFFKISQRQPQTFVVFGVAFQKLADRIESPELG